MREPLVQTQVLSYIREIIKDGIRMSLLTFEPNLKAKWTQKELETEKSKLSARGIDWHYLAYHKSPSTIATAYDVLRGVWLIRQLIHTDKVDILHGRVHLPTLMAALARKISTGKPRILFDIRGFFPEEYTDAGIWSDNGWLYRSAKRVERWLLKQADGFVVLTEQAREILFPESIGPGFDSRGRPVELIQCCVDLKRFESLPG